MADFTATTAATWLPEKWSPLATITERSNTPLWDTFDHRWEPEVVGGGDTVNIPGFSQNASANKRSTFGTAAALSFEAVTEAQSQLLINQMAYKGYRLPVELNPQVIANYTPLLVNGIGTAIALQKDTDVGGDNTNGIDSFTTFVGTDNIDITDDNIVTAMVNLDAQNAPMDSRYFVVSPASKGSVIKIEPARNSLYAAVLGSMNVDKGRGYFGHYMTFDFVESNNLEAGASGKKNGAYHTEAIAVASQSKISIEKDLNIEDGLLLQVVGWETYGFKKVKDAYGNEVDGK